MSLPHILPPPTQTFQDPPLLRESSAPSFSLQKHGPPPYGHRKGWIPRSLEDFGDGGAFPEIPVAQYPQNMGRNRGQKGDSGKSVIPLKLDKDGHIKYDAVVYEGQRKNKVLHTKPQDAKPSGRPEGSRGGVDPSLARPDEEEIDKTTEETRLALEKIIQTKISAAQPTPAAEKRAPVQYVRYTPAQQGAQFNAGSKQRLIHMVEMQKDPMEPPMFNVNKKIPRGPPSPPVPVLHSPPRKVTAKEQQEWKIPPSISNWKNPRGFTIPLDKRLAADGRGLQDPHINDNFAKLSQSLYAADRKAREAIEMRYQIEKKFEEKLNDKREKDLERIARIARLKRVGVRPAAASEQEREEMLEREEIKYDRHKSRERQKRLAKAGKDKDRPDRSKDRDISEKIALGVPAKTTGQDDMFDQRLFDQNKGLSSGYGFEDDTYNVYDQPFRQGGTMADKIYRPRRDLDQDIYGDEGGRGGIGKRFEADKPFTGTDTDAPRPSGPVQFTREADPFGINKYLQRVKRSGVTIENDAEMKRSKY